MDKLAQVRIELEQLEKKERDLAEELYRVRVAIEAHVQGEDHAFTLHRRTQPTNRAAHCGNAYATLGALRLCSYPTNDTTTSLLMTAWLLAPMSTIRHSSACICSLELAAFRRISASTLRFLLFSSITEDFVITTICDDLRGHMDHSSPTHRVCFCSIPSIISGSTKGTQNRIQKNWNGL